MKADGSGGLVLAVLTYLRTENLAELLPLLEQQAAALDHDGCSILVIDNDPAGSAEDVVRRVGSAHVRYIHEPAPGIAQARNRALDEAADATLLVFIDDDERPLDGWLSALLDAYTRHQPTAVTGPVYPEYEADPDPWLLAGGFFVRRMYPDGHRMPAATSANLLLDLPQVRRLGLRFDERFGLTGGSDTLFTRQLIARGGTVVFAPSAGVVDKVPTSRMTHSWTLRRQFRVGTTWSRTSVELATPGVRRLLIRLQLTAGGCARLGVGMVRHALGRATGSLTHQARGSRMTRRGLGIAAGAWGGTLVEYQRPTPADVVTRPTRQRVRSVYRFLRKRLKRLWSRVRLIALRLRNRLSSSSALGRVPVLVSLTSYGTRIETVAYAVESIAAGRDRPRRMVLWLDDRVRYESRPAALRRLEARGLEVRLTENWGPHTKYLPALPLAVADGLPLVTGDDDILYPRSWLARLWAAAQRHPAEIHCYRANLVRLDGDRLAPYAQWPRCRDTVASVTRFATGVSGVWYPPAMLAALDGRGTEFRRYAARADDLWLHWVALRSGLRVRQVSRRPRHFPYIPGSQAQSLVQENVDHGGNDRLIAALYEPTDIATLSGALAGERGGFDPAVADSS